MGELARPEGLEPPAYWFEASRSIRLSYGRGWIHRITWARSVSGPVTLHRMIGAAWEILRDRSKPRSRFACRGALPRRAC
jgi:hypothetical protein